LALVGVVLLVPIVPFLVWGSQLDAWFRTWAEPTRSPYAVAGVVVGLLAGDIVLPVPSSVISTFAGAQLGTLGGTVAAWLGMTLGAVIGFALARWLGPAGAARLSREDDLRQLAAATVRYGPTLLVLARAVPVLAEASVLLMGVHRLAWRRFLPVVAASNLGIASAYAAFGTLAAHYQWLPLALGISAALPIFGTIFVRSWLRNRTRGELRESRTEHPNGRG
jgi:uncharacterized membrane protein YdjX (TVP38/TMEM64 family)